MDPELDTVRKQVEAFVSEPGCSSCHAYIDPLGFLLEGFDAVGRIQTKDARTGAVIDTSADVNVTGLGGDRVRVANPAELMGELTKSSAVKLNYARRWSNFLHENELGASSYCVSDVSSKLSKDGYTIRNLVTDLVATESFYKRVPRE
jgi:hypothetical protein